MLVRLTELSSKMATDGRYRPSMLFDAEGDACMPSTASKQPPSNGKAQCQHVCILKRVSFSRRYRHAHDSICAAAVSMRGLWLSSSGAELTPQGPERAESGHSRCRTDTSHSREASTEQPKRHCKMGPERDRVDRQRALK